MTTLFLHIGTSKAGSTALQDFLSHNRAQLSDQGLEYGPAFATSNHLDLAAAFCSRSTRITRDLGVQGPTHRRRAQRRLARRFDATVEEDARWVISSEHLGTLLTRSEDIAELAAFLRRYFDHIVLVVLLRRVSHWLPSAYVESIRGGSTKLLDAEYVEQRRRLLDHKGLLRRWQNGLRPDHIIALPYLESDKADPSALSLRVLTALGQGRVERNAWSMPSRLSNQAMSAHATEVLRLANPGLRRGRLRPAATRRRATDFLSSTWPGPGPGLTREAASHLRTLGLDDVTIARSRHALGQDWDSWAAQPPPQVRPQTVLTDDERAKAFAVLSRQGLLESPEALRHRMISTRWVPPLRRAWQRLSRPSGHAVDRR